MRSPKAVVFGLDGATMRIVKPLVDQGLLPNIAKLIRTGSGGILRSTVPATTPVAWPAIFTGCNPARHGIFGFYKRAPGSYRWEKSTSLDLAVPTLWDVCGAQGLRSGVFFVPYTYPAKPIDGVMVTGRGGSRDVKARLSHPPSLASELVGRFGSNAVVGKARQVTDVLEDVARNLVDQVKDKTKVVRSLVAENSLDLLFTVWDQTDTVAHLFWHHRELPLPSENSPVIAVYRAVDEGIGEILNEVGGDPLVVLCSDHGTYPLRYRVRMAPWLQQNGFLSLRSTKRESALHAISHTSRRIPKVVRKALPVRRLRRLKRSIQPTVEGDIDWSNTELYPQPATAEALYLNLTGREPEGIVEPQLVADTVARLETALLQSTSPEGDLFVRSLEQTSTVYQGPLLEQAPDLIVETNLGYMMAPSRTGEREVFWEPPVPRLSEDPPRSICYHEPDGLIAFSGPGVKAGGTIEGAKCVDVMPTILSLLALAGPSGLDGKTLQIGDGPLAPPAETNMPLREQPIETGLTEDEEAQIEGQLRDLGYLE